MDKKLSMAVVGLIVMSIAIGVQADVFNGAVDTDWGTDDNWASGTAPGATMTDGVISTLMRFSHQTILPSR